MYLNFEYKNLHLWLAVHSSICVKLNLIFSQNNSQQKVGKVLSFKRKINKNINANKTKFCYSKLLSAQVLVKFFWVCFVYKYKCKFNRQVWFKNKNYIYSICTCLTKVKCYAETKTGEYSNLQTFVSINTHLKILNSIYLLD